jgi:hypothetical protein
LSGYAGIRYAFVLNRRHEWSIGGFKTNKNMNAKWTKIRMILSSALFVSAFLALIAGVNAANPKWSRLYAADLFSPTDGSSTNLDSRLFREGSTTVYDPNSNRIILFGGFLAISGMKALRQNDVWILTNANGTGTVPPKWSNPIPNGDPNSPGIRYNHSAVYDVVNNRMIIYGGCRGGCLPIENNVWVLSNANGCGPGATPTNCLPVTPTWRQLPTVGGPPGMREGHQAVYDPVTNSMIVWAGTDGQGLGFCGSHAYSDVWVLSNANGTGGTATWTKLLPTGTAAVGESFSTAVYDSTNHIMIVFGGSGNVTISGIKHCQSFDGVWTLSNANGMDKTVQPKWRRLFPQGDPNVGGTSPEPREQHVAVYEPISNTMTIFGGYFTDHNEAHPRIFWGDTWKLSNANGMGGTPTWTLIDDGTNGGPAPSVRWNGGTIDTANHLMMFGGSSNEGPLWSTWLLDVP